MGDAMKRFLPLLLMLLLASTGCSVPPEPPLRVGINPWIGYDALVLARDLDGLDPNQVRVVEMAAASEVIRGLRSGVLEGAGLTLDQLIGLRAEGFDLRVVAVLNVSNGGDGLVARPDIESLAGLRGHRLALEDNTLATLVLHRVLAEAGLSAQDVALRYASITDHERLYAERQVDALVTFEPVLSHLRAQGARVLFDSRRMPGEIVDVLAIRGDVLDRQQARVVDLLRRLDQGGRPLREADPAVLAKLAPGVGMTVADYARTLAGVGLVALPASLTMLSDPAFVRRAEALAATLHSLGEIDRVPPSDGLVDVRAAMAAAGSGGGK